MKLGTKTVSLLIALVVVVIGYGFIPTQPSVEAQDGTGQYALVNGVNMYYEIHGEGDPLILIHGGLGTIDMLFGALLPALAESRQVIAVELQGHGHTADIDRPLSFEFMADDIAALIDYLGYEQVDVVGFSLGGGVGLQTAIRHPEKVRKLVLISAAFKSDGWYPEVQEGMAAMNAEAAAFMLETPLYEFYSAVAPNVEDWPTLVAKSGELQRQEYDWSDDVAEIDIPVLILVGDADHLQPSHALELYGLLGGGMADLFTGELANADSQLAILPATTHFDILFKTDLLIPVIVPFLEADVAA